MSSIMEEQSRKIKSLEKSIQLKDLSLAEADLKIQVYNAGVPILKENT